MNQLFQPKKRLPIPADAERVTRRGKVLVQIGGREYPVADCGTKYVRLDPKWCADVRGADGQRCRYRLSTDKTAAMTLLAKLLKDIEQEKAGIRTPATAQAGRPLSALLSEYRAHHADKGNTPEQTAQAVRRCELTFTGCGFLSITDPDATAAERWLADKRSTPKTDGGFGARTSNHYVTALKAFGNWLVKARRIAENPFRFLGKVNTETDIRHVRRPLTDDEFARLIRAAEAGDEFRGLSGPDRAMLYVTAGYTGLRASELASLTSASFQFDAATPSLIVAAGYSKRKRNDSTVPLHPDLARQLRPWVTGKAATVPLWPGKWAVHNEAVDLMRRDLTAARTA